jgi:hypothetical protein
MKRLNHHNYLPEDYSNDIINKLIHNKRCRINAIYKENNILCSDEEFQKRFYKIKESFERLPKISNYYKNYLKYFCRPKVVDLKKNSILENNGEIKAENYYKKNYYTRNDSKNKIYELIFTKSVLVNIEEREKSISQIFINEEKSIMISKSILDIVGDIEKEKIIISPNVETFKTVKNISPKTIKNYKSNTKLQNVFNKNRILFPNINIYNTHISKSNKNLKVKDHNIEKVTMNRHESIIDLKSLNNPPIKPAENIRYKKLIDPINKPIETNSIIINKSLSRNVIKFLQDKTEEMKIFKTYNVKTEGNNKFIKMKRI